MRGPWSLLLCLVVAGPALAEEPGPVDAELDALDLDDLLSLEVSVASLKATSVRESPGIVSVITREDILASGARDLIDVLREVPGFFFGVDVQGSVGVGIRGNWAHEGKLLLVVDGHEMNELGYQTTLFGHHYPVEAIERIEIIRGPGSAIYGGSAELGVVKVTTRAGAAIEGVRASARYAPPHGFYAGDGDSVGLIDGTLEVGRTHGELEWSLTGAIGRSVRSDNVYTALDGVTYDLGTNSTLTPLFLSGQLAYGQHHLRVAYDGYTVQSRDGFDVVTDVPLRFLQGGLFVEASSTFTLAEGLQLMPRLGYKRQQSYASSFDTDEERAVLVDTGLWSDRTYQRALVGATLSWDAFARANIVLGAEAFYDHAYGDGPTDDTRSIDWFRDDAGNEVQTLEFVTVAGFAQLLWPTDVVNFTVGGRVEGKSGFGVSAVPRVALTKVFDIGVHAKLLAAQAFRMPSVLNKSLEKVVDPNNEVTPERTTVIEAELGYQLAGVGRVTVNGFYTQIDDPIIYTYDEAADQETYFNRGQTKTAGAELELASQLGPVRTTLGYSFYAAVGDAVEDYAVPGTSALLAAPQHKLVARLSWEVARKVIVAPSLVLMAGRYAYTPTSPDAPEALPTEALVGLTVSAEDVGGLSGLGLALSGHDLLDTVARFPQPYAGGHAPLFGSGRQVMLRLSYAYER